MKPGQASRTAVAVCMGRAAAQGATSVTAFDDPTALALLPAGARARVERLRAGVPGATLLDRLKDGYVRTLSRMAVARTVAIDDAVREAACPQLVILGAGLDGRAWRMAELGEAVVFEVDHPDTQREKRERASGLGLKAAEVRFVPVDFSRDRLGDALASAGHDPSRPTAWLWEGVVMYLTPAQVEATLAVLAGRSVPGSRLIVLYHKPALVLRLIGPLLRLGGEPLRSAYEADAMRELLERHAFRVARDEDVATLGGRLSADVARQTRRLTHMRLAIADRAVPDKLPVDSLEKEVE